jgi:hypothetical protein
MVISTLSYRSASHRSSICLVGRVGKRKTRGGLHGHLLDIHRDLRLGLPTRTLEHARLKDAAGSKTGQALMQYTAMQPGPNLRRGSPAGTKDSLKSRNAPRSRAEARSLPMYSSRKKEKGRSFVARRIDPKHTPEGRSKQPGRFRCCCPDPSVQ